MEWSCVKEAMVVVGCIESERAKMEGEEQSRRRIDQVLKIIKS